MFWDTTIWVFENGYEWYFYPGLLIVGSILFYINRRLMNNDKENEKQEILLTDFEKLDAQLK